MYHCRICNHSVRKLNQLRKHHTGVHKSLIPLTKQENKQIKEELQYSFYNSPKELKLDLGDYVITVARKQK